MYRMSPQYLNYLGYLEVGYKNLLVVDLSQLHPLGLLDWYNQFLHTLGCM